MLKRRALAVLPATLGLLTVVPSNAGKLLALLALWWACFGRLKRVEGILVVLACALFTVMDRVSLATGLLRFHQPDLWGLPCYEIFMWGFYLLQGWRVLGDTPPSRPSGVPNLLVVPYLCTFALISEPWALLLGQAVVLAGILVHCHERLDLAYAGYFLLMGTLVEYTGVLAGLWSYPGKPFGGVPLWYVTLWAGVGLFLRRVVLPLVLRLDGAWPSGFRSASTHPGSWGK